MPDKLREKIEQILINRCEECVKARFGDAKDASECVAEERDQILAKVKKLCANCDTPLLREGELYQKLEEQGFAKGIAHYRKVILPTMVEEAKKQEGERIISIIKREVKFSMRQELVGTTNKEQQWVADNLEGRTRQALKGEK